MNELLNNLIDKNSTVCTPAIFDMDFSEYFLPNDPEEQARLRDYAANALYWHELLSEGISDPEQTLNRADAFTTQVLAMGLVAFKALLKNTAHGEDNE